MKQYIAIDGMHCNGCVSRVKDALQGMEGMEEVEVTLHPGQAIIASKINYTAEQLESQLSGVGQYEVEVLDAPREEAPPMIQLDVVKDRPPGVYYCPMLCEGDKKYDHFRDCPVCGMDLVLDESASILSGDAGDDGPYKQLLRKFYVALLFTIPVFFISMGEMVGIPIHSIASPSVMGWVQLALALPVVFYACWNFFQRGFRSLVNRSPNMWTLILLGAGSAFLFSVMALLVPQFFPESFKDAAGNVHLYFEATVVILTLVLLGQLIEAKAHNRTSKAIKDLIELVPPRALVIRNGKEQQVDLEDIRVGEVIVIKPGDKIPVDGYLIEGSGVVDESMISGEPMPIDKKPEDQVIGGTINSTGSFKMRAEKIGAETMLAQIIQMVSNASKTRAPIQRLADKIAYYFVPVVVSIAVIAFMVWGVWGPDPSWVYALTAAISVLIIACPCALGLATPMSVMVGTGRGAQEGILFKDAITLEQLSSIDTLVIDKTGTLTEGRPALKEIFPANSWEKDDVLTYAASIEKQSEHPISTAIVAAANEKGLKLLPCHSFESVTGKGLLGWVDNRQVTIGNLKFLREKGFTVDPQDLKMIDDQSRKGESVVYVAVDQTVAGFLFIDDPIKGNALNSIKRIKDRGIEVVMMTGDVEKTARSVADQLGIQTVHYGMLPQDKHGAVKSFQEQGKKVAMAGDGINDAPALVQADIGIAMGTGTDIAIESADMTLVNGDISSIHQSMKLSDSVMTNIRQNLFFAFIYNVIGVPIAAGVLFPFFGVLLSPMLAALAMSLSSVSVISNSLRLQGVNLE